VDSIIYQTFEEKFRGGVQYIVFFGVVHPEGRKDGSLIGVTNGG